MIRTDVLIIGGGIVGTSCAHELARRGLKVTVIDKGEIGHGCSYGNAGWITPCIALPLPMPGMFLQSVKWLTNPESPLYIQPRLNWELIRWLTRFSLSMNKKLMQQSAAALIELAKYSLGEYRRLDSESPGEFGFTQKGLLLVAQTRATLAAGMAKLELVAKHGVRGRKLDVNETRQLEPAVTGPIVGSVYFPDEAHAEPLATVKALMNRATKLGATFLPNTELFDFNDRGSVIESVRTTHGELRADKFILATGAWSSRLAAKLGVRVSVLSGKGYAVEIKPFEPKPSIPLYLLDRKIGVTPRQDSIRLAGTLELVGLDESITSRRVEAILRGAKEYLSFPDLSRVVEVWRGLRPCTPDGVPIIGRSPRLDNLFIATGHQMIGLLSAPGTALLVAELMAGSSPSFDPHPFRASRF